MMRYSVVVPVYNGEETLGQCLEALSDQSVSPSEYEIVVVDDGSADTTPQIAAAWGVRYLHQANKGPASARNRGAFSARGEIVLFTDCDCVPDRNWIEEMVRPFSDTGVSGVKGAYRTHQKSLTARFAQAEFEDRFRLLQKTDRIDMVDTYSAAFRKSVFVQAGGFDASFPHANNEDTEFSYRLAAAGHKLVFNPHAYVYHRHPDSLKKYLKIKFWRGYWRIVVYARYPNKMIKDSYTPFSVKLQALSAASVFVFLPLAPFLSIFLQTAFFALLVILVSSIPFSATSYKNDKTVGGLSPFYSFLRAFAFAAGSTGGLFEVLLRKTSLHRALFYRKTQSEGIMQKSYKTWLYMEMKAAMLFFFGQATKIFPLKMSRGIAKGFLRYGGLSFFRKREGKKETAEKNFLETLALRGKVVYDIGAHEGLFSLFFSQRVGKQGTVVAFEPNLYCFRILKKNIEINGVGNILPLPVGVNGKKAVVETSFCPYKSSMTSTVRRVPAFINKNVVLTLDRLDRINDRFNMPAPDFIKIDVEGLDYEVMEGLDLKKLNYPDLFVELHVHHFFANPAQRFKQIYNFLKSCGYTIFDVERKQTVLREFTNRTGNGHIYCTRDV